MSSHARANEDTFRLSITVADVRQQCAIALRQLPAGEAIASPRLLKVLQFSDVSEIGTHCRSPLLNKIALRGAFRCGY